MPILKNRMVFISHAWQYNEHYWKIVEWLDEAQNFSWFNCSVPSHDGLPDKTSAGLRSGMTKQIASSQVLILLGGMYAAHSNWIEYEISEAQKMNRTIIGVSPWGQELIPVIVQNASICPVVGWNSASVIQAVRDFT